jgi:hypothetical protein
MNGDDVVELLEKWKRRIRAAHKAHYRDAVTLEKRQRHLGLIVVALSTLVGTSLFASLASNNSDIAIKIVTGLLSIAATILAALHTFLNYSERRVNHLMASAQLSSLKKRIEEVLVVEEDHEALKRFIHDVRSEWDSVTNSAPLLSDKAFSAEIAHGVSEQDFEV